MKTKTTFKYPEIRPQVMALREAVALPGVGLVAGGQEVTITSDGVPKAVLSPVGKKSSQKVFTGTWTHLKKMPPWRGGPTAEEIIRADRDGRGW